MTVAPSRTRETRVELAADAFFAQRVGRFDLVGRRAAARTHDEASAWVANLLWRQARLLDGVFQSNLSVGSRVAHEAQLFAVNARFDVDLRRASHLAAQTQFLELFHGLDTALARTQRGFHGGQIVANARDDARAGDDYALFGHAASLPSSSRLNKPTRRSLAT